MLRDYYKVRFPLEKIFLVVYDEPANEGGQDMFPVQLRERHATVSGSRSIWNIRVCKYNPLVWGYGILCKKAKKNRKTPAISDALRFFSFQKGRHLGRRRKDRISPQILVALSILAGSHWVAIFRNRRSLMTTPVYWQYGLLHLNARCSVVSAMRPQLRANFSWHKQRWISVRPRRWHKLTWHILFKSKKAAKPDCIKTLQLFKFRKTLK